MLRFPHVLVLMAVLSPFAMASGEFDDVYLRGRAELHTGNDDKGIVLLREAAAGGHPTAQEHLAYLYGSETYTPQDPEELISWLEEKATAGDPLAQHWLGRSFFSAKRNARDRKRGLKLFVDAAQRGLPNAQYELARLYDKGPGSRNDPIVAARWYGRAADAGHADAQYEYGLALAKGEGVGRDPANAYVYLSLASRQGHEEAAQRAEKLARKLSPETLLAAGNATDAWTSKRDVQAIELEPGVYLSGHGGVSKAEIRLSTPLPLHERVPFYAVVDLRIDDGGTIVDATLIDANNPTIGRNIKSWLAAQKTAPSMYRGNPVHSIRRTVLYRAAPTVYHQFGSLRYPGGTGRGPTPKYRAERLDLPRDYLTVR